MEEKEIRQLSELLAEGHSVCLKHVIVRAVQVPEDDIACYDCDMHEKCDMTILAICAEIDGIMHRHNKLVIC